MKRMITVLALIGFLPLAPVLWGAAKKAPDESKTTLVEVRDSEGHVVSAKSAMELGDKAFKATGTWNQEALSWYKLAGEKGSTDAQMKLAGYYSNSMTLDMLGKSAGVTDEGDLDKAYHSDRAEYL